MRHIHLVLLLGISVLAVNRDAGAQRPTTEQTALLTRLYEEFSLEATGGDDSPGARTFVDQPKRVLLRYMVAGLADLLMRDSACARRSKAICRLDFTPLWGSRDPEAAPAP